MVKVQEEIDVRATPARILAVIADLPAYPRWSAVHRKAVVDDRFDDGRPRRATMHVAAMGLVDEQVLTYRWRPRGVSWELVHAGQQRAQHGSYTITPRAGGVSHVSYALEITPAIPVPDFLARAVLRKAAHAATAGLKSEVERRQ